jgi:hypothetical protein
MKTIIIAYVIVAAAAAFAQQDPDDPGTQDSIIIESMQIGEPPRSFIVNVQAVTDDPVAYVVVPLSYLAPAGGFEPDDVFFYNNIMGWEYQWHSIDPDSHMIFIRAWSDTAYMNTAGQRLLIAGLHFQNHMAPPQNMTIDTTWDAGLQRSIGLKTYDDTSTITPGFLPGTVYYLPQAVNEGEFSDEPELPMSYPNPWGSSGVQIKFSLASDQIVRIAVYNILGQKIWGAKGAFRKGYNSITWKGIDYDGNLIRGGVYFYRIETSDGMESGKFTFLR